MEVLFRISELILEARKKGKKITQKDLARAANISQSSVSMILAGKTKDPSVNILRAWARLFSKILGRPMEVGDLYSESSPASESDNHGNGELLRRGLGASDASPHENVLLPIIGDIPYGDIRLIAESDIIGWQRGYKGLGHKRPFFLRAKGLSMSPIISDGDLLLIEPGEEWGSGSIVIAYVGGAIACKKLLYLGGLSLLIPLNPNYEPMVLTDGHIIGRVLASVKTYVDKTEERG